MNILLLGRGKTGSLVAEVARQRGHRVQVAGSAENAGGAAITAEKLRDIELVIDFTAPHCVVSHIEVCVNAAKSMVVGTTGWSGEIERFKRVVESHGSGLVYAANFSLAVNLFLDVARTAAAALRHDYTGQIFERHHIHKTDAPSRTAIALRRVMREASGKKED